MSIFETDYVPNAEGSSYHPKWVKANPGEADKWAAYRDAVKAHKKGNTAPAVPSLNTKYGKSLIAAGRLQVSVTDLGSVWVPPPPPDEGGGYTTVASVDLSRNPVPPLGSTTTNISSPITINGSVSDVTYNVTTTMTNAITLGGAGRMERVVVNCNGLAQNGIVGGGTCKDVLVTRATDSGFRGVQHFEGCCKSSRCFRGFRLTGSGITQPADCLLKSDDDDRFGFYVISLSNSNFLGAVAAINGSATLGTQQATGWEIWSGVSNTSWNIIISNNNPGYGVAIYGAGSFGNTFKEIYCDGRPTGGDPGLSIGGGAHDNVIDKCTTIAYIVGCIMGEDVSPSPYNNRVKTLICQSGGYPGIILDRGAHDNTIGEVGGATITNMGSSGSYLGAIHIANRSGQTETPPYGNEILGLNQSGSSIVPEYAVHIGAGTTGNTVTGSATSWSVAKVLNQSSSGANTITV